MPVEDPNGVISGLDPTSPLDTEQGSDAAPHLRKLSKLLQDQFPGAGGSGFAKTITATEDDLNNCEGLVANVQSQLNEALNNRIPTVPSATSGNIAAFDSAGKVYDTGVPIAALIDLIS